MADEQQFPRTHFVAGVQITTEHVAGPPPRERWKCGACEAAGLDPFGEWLEPAARKVDAETHALRHAPDGA